MSVVPVLSRNALAYMFGSVVGSKVAPLLLNKMTQHLNSCSTSARKKIECLVPLIGMGIATLAAYSLYPHSKALTPHNLFSQGMISSVHTCAMNFFLYKHMGIATLAACSLYPHSNMPINLFFQRIVSSFHACTMNFFLYEHEDHDYSLQAQIRKYQGPSHWINIQKQAESELRLVQEWKFCDKLNPNIKENLAFYLPTETGKEINIANFTTQDPEERGRIQRTLDEFKQKEIQEQKSIASTLHKYYSTGPEECYTNLKKLETQLTAQHTVSKIFEGVAMIIAYTFHDLLMGPSVPIALTDRCCALFPPFYLIRKFVPLLGFTCNKNIIFYHAALDSITAIARSLLEYLPPESSD